MQGWLRLAEPCAPEIISESCLASQLTKHIHLLYFFMSLASLGGRWSIPPSIVQGTRRAFVLLFFLFCSQCLSWSLLWPSQSNPAGLWSFLFPSGHHQGSIHRSHWVWKCSFLLCEDLFLLPSVFVFVLPGKRQASEGRANLLLPSSSLLPPLLPPFHGGPRHLLGAH